MRNFFAGMVGVLAMACGCTQPPVSSPESVASQAGVTNRQTFEVKGVIQEVKAGESRLIVKHEEIPNYMPAMTMPLDVKQTNELAGLSAGDEIQFTMVVTEEDGWIEQIRKTGVSTNVNPTTRAVRLVRDVEPLDVGDLMPDYSFTNSLGNKVSLSDFKGQAIAFTFIFTRCPFPNFCPRMNINFQRAFEALTEAGGPTNWHFLSISFDPEFDTPERLKDYSASYNPDPEKWDWVTGALIDIDAITEQFGLYFAFNNGTFDHNLRTVVIDAGGKVHHVFVGNEWKPEELVEKVVEAAKVK